MIVPGSNLLNMAMGLIAPQSVMLYRATGTTTRADGIKITSYGPGEVVTGGSVQAVNRARYNELGLDLKKQYVMWYAGTSATGTTRTSPGDQFVFAGVRYQLLDENDWLNIDGWQGLMAIGIGNE